METGDSLGREPTVTYVRARKRAIGNNSSTSVVIVFLRRIDSQSVDQTFRKDLSISIAEKMNILHVSYSYVNLSWLRALLACTINLDELDLFRDWKKKILAVCLSTSNRPLYSGARGNKR